MSVATSPWTRVALLALLLPACSADAPTQIDIHVTAGADLTALTAVVVVESRTLDVDGDEAIPYDAYVYGDAVPLAWPLHVAVAPTGGDAERTFYVVLEARDAEGSALASAIVEGRFTEGERVEVAVDLADCCIGIDHCSRTILVPDAGDAVAEVTCLAEPGVADAPAHAPTLIGPDNGATTGSIHAPGSLLPSFSWEPVPSANRYEVELSDRCTAAALPGCAFAGARGELTGGTSLELTTPLSASTTSPVGSRWAWRVRGCAEDACGPWSGVRYLDVGRLPNDVDGDGYSDLVVGAPDRSDGGAVYLFHGAAGGPSLAPSASLEAPAGAAHDVGAALAVGDLDGDGFADVVVGAPGGGGRVLVFRGLAGRALSPARELAPPAADGATAYGTAVAVADVDGDGYRDLVIGAPGVAGAAGSAYVHRWGPDGPSGDPRLLLGSGSTTSFGAGITSLGDVDSDGLEDVLVGAPGGEVPVAHLFRGSDLDPTGGSSSMLSSGSGRQGDGYGVAAASVADFDGDGRRDIAVGADAMGGGGAVLLYTVTGFPDRFETVGHIVRGGAPGERFGAALACVGDLDGDGLVEVIVGASDAGGVGAVRIISSASVSTEPATELSPPVSQSGAAFGAALASAGDVDGDGFLDLVVAAPGWDGGQGRVFLYTGLPEGLSGPIEVPAPAGGGGGAFGRLPPVR